jgi:hypothetical protein
MLGIDSENRNAAPEGGGQQPFVRLAVRPSTCPPCRRRLKALPDRLGGADRRSFDGQNKDRMVCPIALLGQAVKDIGAEQTTMTHYLDECWIQLKDGSVRQLGADELLPDGACMMGKLFLERFQVK